MKRGETRSGRPPRAARLRPSDVVRVGGAGLRSRPIRVVLSALGIAIGIAAMISVVGISASSHVQLDRTLDRLGTNLLTVSPGVDPLTLDPATLPTESVSMIGRIGPVMSVAAIGSLPAAQVYRNNYVPVGQTGSIAVMAAQLDLLGTVGAHITDGVWLNSATAAFPTTVLGAGAAERLGVTETGARAQVWLGDRWFTVIGVLDPVPLAPELDSAALVGWGAATTYLGFDGHPTTIYCRANKDHVTDVRDVLAATADPQAPLEVRVSRPSDALAARQETDKTFTALLLALGAVALLVGGIGVANTMVISVLERRSEIGLRRSLGATRGQIRTQFFGEALLLSLFGGAGGVLIGIAVTGAYATTAGWPTRVPPLAMAAGLGATLLIGGVAGLYPAMRAARLAPTAALSAP